MAEAFRIWGETNSTKEKKNLHGIIGSACAVVCHPVGILAAYWAIPVVSWQCNSPGLSDKNYFPTFTRTDHSWTGLAPIYNALAAEFGWNKVAVLCTDVESFTLTTQAVIREMERHGREVVYRVVDSTVRGTELFQYGYDNLRKVISALKHEVNIGQCHNSTKTWGRYRPMSYQH